MTDSTYFTPGKEIWIRTSDEGWVKAVVDRYQAKPFAGLTLEDAYKEDRFASYIDIRILEGKREGEGIRLPLNYVTVSLFPPALPGISGDLEDCNSRYNLKQLQNIASEHRVAFSGLTKLELCRKLIEASVIK